MENNKNKKSVKFQGDMLNFCDFIQVFVFTPNHHLNALINQNGSMYRTVTIIIIGISISEFYRTDFTSLLYDREIT